MTTAAGSALPRHRTSAADGAETKARLIEVARRLFAEKGHAAVSTTEICDVADVTRGALYHHFPGKDGLFRAVCEQIAGDLTARVVAAAAGEPGAWARVRAGCVAFLEASTDDDVRQVLLTDAPSVLGWEGFREIDDRHCLGLLRMSLRSAVEEGAIPPGPVDEMAHLLVAALNEAAMVVARAPDRAVAGRAAMTAVDRLLAGIAGAGVSAPGDPV